MAEETSSNAVQSPDVTTEIPQQFFIERLSTSKSPKNYLDHFPTTIYNTGEHTNLYALMAVLLGPYGIGSLRQNYFEARIAIENAGLKTTNLDWLYNNIFAFARIATEVYEQDTEGLLTQEQYEQIQASDKSYQARAKEFLAAARAGGTPLGLRLAAKSGLNRNVELVENYRALYDEHSDDRLGIQWLGVTRSTEEVILLPRHELPTSAVQVIQFNGELPPITGFVTLAMPLGEGETNANKSPNNPSTIPIPFDASAHQVQLALEALPQVGAGNIIVNGGPLDSKPIEIMFTAELSDRKIPGLLVTANSVANIEEKQVVLEVEEKVAGVGADGQEATVAPEDWHYAETAINQIKPVTAFISPGKSPGVTKRQVPSAVAADSNMVEVIRYISGTRSVKWPPVDSTHFIVAGQEKEAPKTVNGGSAHYTKFHDISTITAYTGEALEDPDYEAGTFVGFLDTHIGVFDKEQREIYPFLETLSDPTHVYHANDAAGLTELATAGEGGFIQGIYSPDYLTAPGAEPAKPEKNKLWASTERSEGIDVLEIDFGTVQAINYISFEAGNKPYNINVAYDLLDAAPERSFVDVTYLEPHLAETILALGFEPKNPNFWNTIKLSFTNALGAMIYTRFVRLEFTKRSGAGSIFTHGGENHPYSIEVRNLRVGRNIS